MTWMLIVAGSARCRKRVGPKAPVNSFSADARLPWSADASASVSSVIVPHMIGAPKTPSGVLPAATAARTKVSTSAAPPSGRGTPH